MNASITYVAMDTHKKDHTLAIQYPCSPEIVQCRIANTQREIERMVKRIARKAPGQVCYCYEAGVCGFTLKRRIEDAGGVCTVIAPSLTPIKPGERIKTDRRDASKLLELFKADLLTEVHAPSAEQEAAREITRCRDSARVDLERSRHQLLKFLNRHGCIYPPKKKHWTQQHRSWLNSLQFDNSLLRNAFGNYIMQMEHCRQRLESLDKQVQDLARSEPYREIVGLLRCFYGIDTLTAINIVTELFDLGRFDSPRALMSYLGLTPSEHSSGQSQRKGGITKAGNKRLRRLFIETSWHYRHVRVTGVILRQRRAGQPQWGIDLADQTAERLRRRYWHLIHRGKSPCKANAAVARELAGFIWKLFDEYTQRAAQAS